MASDDLVPVFALEVGNARVDEEPRRRTTDLDHVPGERSVEPGVPGPARRLVTPRAHGGVGDEAREPGRGRKVHIGILDPRPPGKRPRPIAVDTGLEEEVGEDRSGELFLELMVRRVREDGDPDPDLGRPPQVGEEPVPTAAVLKEIGPGVPAMPDHAERVAGRRAGPRRRNRPHLVKPPAVEHDAAVDRAAVQLEAEEPREIAGARVEAPAPVIGS